MEEEDSTFTDGTFQSERFFTCASNRALFLPLNRCKPYSPYQDQDAVVEDANAIDAQRLSDISPSKKLMRIIPGVSRTDEKVRKHSILSFEPFLGLTNQLYNVVNMYVTMSVRPSIASRKRTASIFNVRPSFINNFIFCLFKGTKSMRSVSARSRRRLDQV